LATGTTSQTEPSPATGRWRLLGLDGHRRIPPAASLGLLLPPLGMLLLAEAETHGVQTRGTRTSLGDWIGVGEEGGGDGEPPSLGRSRLWEAWIWCFGPGCGCATTVSSSTDAVRLCETDFAVSSSGCAVCAPPHDAEQKKAVELNSEGVDP
jgi:hypothetical protein